MMELLAFMGSVIGIFLIGKGALMLFVSSSLNKQIEAAKKRGELEIEFVPPSLLQPKPDEDTLSYILRLEEAERKMESIRTEGGKHVLIGVVIFLFCRILGSN